MAADQGTLIGQVVAGIVGLAIGAFIILRVIQAIAAFVNALEGKESVDEGSGDETPTKTPDRADDF